MIIITKAGFFLLPLGIFLLFFPRKYLFYIMCFFASFSGMSVVNFNIFSIDFSLQPGYWYGVLYIIKYLFFCIRIKKIRIVKNNKYCNIFMILVVLSIVLCLIVGNYDVDVYGIGNGLKIIRAKFSSTNITMFIYLLFCYIIYILSKTFWLTENKIEYGFFIFGCSSITMCLIGVLQKALINRSELFNSIFRSNVSSWNQTNERIQAATGEASILGMLLAISLCYFIVYMCEDSLINIGGTLLLLLTGIYSKSSTFVIGVLICLGTYVFFSINNKVKKKKIRKTVVVFLGVVVVLLGLYMAIPDSINIIISKTISKFNLSDKSGNIRMKTTIQMLKVGVKYPLLGVGYGTGRATDLYSTLFGTVGLGGLCSFLLFIFAILKKMNSVANNKIAKVSKMMLVTFFVCSIAIPDLNYLYIWILFGMIEALGENNTLDDCSLNNGIS